MGRPSAIPWPDAAFDLILNRHGSFDAPELFRLPEEQGQIRGTIHRFLLVAEK